jgi:hypothetical protein
MDEQNIEIPSIQSYQSANIVYETIQKEYESELNRSTKLDNKINIAVTLCGVLFIFILRFTNFLAIVNATSQNSMSGYTLHDIKVVCIIGNIAIIVLFVYIVISLIKLLGTRGFLHISGDELFDKQIYELTQEQAQIFISARWLAASAKNNETNEARSKKYDKTIRALIIMISICVAMEIIKCNFLGLGM